MGDVITEEREIALRQQYGLYEPMDRPIPQLGARRSSAAISASRWNTSGPVPEVIGDRMWLTVAVALASVIFVWLMALPIGIYSAVRQYSVGDYAFTFIGFLGLAIPNFLLALVVMYFSFRYFGANVGGLFSDGLPSTAPWSFAQGLGSPQPHLDTGDHPRDSRNGGADPHHARQPPRRAAKALCRRGEGARPLASGG